MSVYKLIPKTASIGDFFDVQYHNDFIPSELKFFKIIQAGKRNTVEKGEVDWFLAPSCFIVT